jgi:hypothetical protein
MFEANVLGWCIEWVGARFMCRIIWPCRLFFAGPHFVYGACTHAHSFRKMPVVEVLPDILPLVYSCKPSSW